ncbi:MAG TPA: cation:proton antiporter [bacterium]|nr:cation:proton antiporter [bacterium]
MPGCGLTLVSPSDYCPFRRQVASRNLRIQGNDALIMNSAFFTDLIIILLLTILIVYLGHRIKLPIILGFLLTGILVGPYGFHIVAQRHEVELFAEIGVILLLFEIGIEFSLRELFRARKMVLLGGGLQVFVTILIVGLISLLTGIGFSQAFIYGAIVALSSTAIVLKYLKEHGLLDTPYGGMAVSVLIFQDLAIVPLLLIVQFLSSAQEAAPGLSLFIIGGKSLLFIGLTIVLAKYVFPPVLQQIARTRSRELFGISVIGFCFSLAWLAGWVGLSVSIGAFLAGLIVSESEYGHQTLGFVLPFRDLFVSLFFISIGMLLDLGFVLRYWYLILLCVVGVVLIKSVLTTLAVRVSGASLRNAIIAGLGLSQIGEFAFVLAEAGHQGALIPDFFYQLFLATAIITMALTVVYFPAGVSLTEYLSTHRIFGNYFIPRDGEEPVTSYSNHLIVIGYGVIGRHIARMADKSGIPYSIIELNPETVRVESAKGIPIIYGDGMFEPVLEKAGLKHARMLAITIPDPVGALRITNIARSQNPEVSIIVRTRFVRDQGMVSEAGADQVVAEEHEVAESMGVYIQQEFGHSG